MTASKSPHPSQRPLIPLAAVLCLAMAAITMGAVALGWHRFVPILGRWEHFQFYYNYGSVDPYLSFAISPRANLGGKGYPLLDIGVYITDLFGLTLTHFRAVTYVYALSTFSLLVIVFSRWFGRGPALVGVTITLLSSGFLIFSNQLLVMIPTLMLCVILVERCQRLTQTPDSKWLIPVIGLVVALLLIHYAMGRFFAVGWLAFYFGHRLISARLDLGPGEAWRRTFRAEAKTACLIGLAAIIILCILSYRNAYYLLDPWNVFFPRVGTEVEMDPGDLWGTIATNAGHIAEMLFPFIRISGDGLPEALMSAFRGPILNLWHTPLLILGFLVAVHRAVLLPRDKAKHYLGLHAIFVLTVLLSLFSEQFNGRSTISVYRIFCGYFAFAGYITVAVLWLAGFSAAWPSRVRAAAAAISFIAVGIWAVCDLEDFRKTLDRRLDSLAQVNAATGQFQPIPETLPYGSKVTTYLQARYAKLADLIAPALACATGDMPLILRIDPAVLLNRNKYEGIHYLRLHNDLSATLAFYLADHGINSGHVIIHAKGDPGYRSRGDGYAGKARVFSGPISWADSKIIFKAKEPWRTVLKSSRLGVPPDVLVTFSQAESHAAAALFRQQGQHFLQSRWIKTVASLASAQSAAGSLCPPPS